MSKSTVSRHQIRLHAIKSVYSNTAPTYGDAIKPYLEWDLVLQLYSAKLVGSEPLQQVLQIIDNRKLFGEVLVTLYDLNIKGFACVDSARGELCISALYEEYYK